MIITIDGTNCTGKTTFINWLTNNINASVDIVKMSGDTPMSVEQFNK